MSDKRVESIVPPSYDDGSILSTSSFYGLSLDLGGFVKDENDLIRRYREAADYPDCSNAIEEVVNEAISVSDDFVVVSLNVEHIKIQDSVKKALHNEFTNVLHLLDFNDKGYDIFRQWYIDGKVHFHAVVDNEKPKLGIQELRYIDPRKIRKIKEVKIKKDDKGNDIKIDGDNYFLYNDSGFGVSTKSGVKLSIESVLYTNSGIIDYTTGLVRSHLHNAIKIVNSLKYTEESLVIYRVSRAPERRVFYIDVGTLNKAKADQYIQDTMARFRKKLIFNSSTGEINDDTKSQSMMEDYWLARREGGKGTEIQTLEGGCFSMDTKVSLLDGRELSIREIEQEMKEGKTLWTYSCDEFTGAVKPGLISWAGVTQKSAKVMKITLDNGESLICTPDHKFPIYGEGFKQAKDFVVGESLIPLYRRKEHISDYKKRDYEQFFDNKTKRWNYTHRMVGEHVELPFEIYEEDYRDGLVIHHKNINRFDNSPENLCYMSWTDHRILHNSIGFPPMMGTIAAAAKMAMERELNSEWYQQRCEKSSISSLKYYASLSEEEFEEHKRKLTQGINDYFANRTEEQKQRDYEVRVANFKLGNQEFCRKLLEDPEFKKFVSDGKKASWENNDERRRQTSERFKFHNARIWADPEISEYRRKKHKENQLVEFDNLILCAIIDAIRDKTTHEITRADVANILNNNEECLESLAKLNEHKNVPNWNIKIGFTPGLLNKCVKQFGFKSWKELRITYSNHNHRVVSIEYLSDEIEVGTLTIDQNELIHNHHTFALSCGVFTKNSNLGEISDIVYFQNKLFRSLHVPLSRLIPEQSFSIGRSGEITREEIKFSKFITRLRSKFAKLFIEALRLQCVLKGIMTYEDFAKIEKDIRFNYNQDNHFAELTESDILQNRLANLQIVDQYVGKYFDTEWVKKNILKQTEEEIKEMGERMKLEQPPQEETETETE